ncbi:MAG: hypothetical protein Ct9H300mP19_09140 [Dehalococcoidia bacterium]|nr:MAG: hypothetical protein Ct9H300mP19_09140 [Dehalococcoidia bacterium]
MGWDDNGLPTERGFRTILGSSEPNIPYVENLDVDAKRAELGLKKNQQLVVSRQNLSRCVT